MSLETVCVLVAMAATIIVMVCFSMKNKKAASEISAHFDQGLARLTNDYATLLSTNTQMTTAAIVNATATLSGKSAELQESSKKEAQEKMQAINEDILKNMTTLKGIIEEALRSGRTEQARSLQDTFSAFEDSMNGLRNSVTQSLSGIGETSGQIMSASKDIQSLNAILRNPQGRGWFGEMQLESILGNVFGNSGLYIRQYVIEANEKVDTAVFIDSDKSRIIGIDSKFPLANAMPLMTGNLGPEERQARRKLFETDVIKRAEEISSKYIKPPKTEDFAVMFVPSESVYALICESNGLLERLGKMKVMLASPTTLAALLRVILSNISREKLAKNANDIYNELNKVAKDLNKFNDEFSLLGRHLSNASSKFSDAEKIARQFTEHVDKLKKGDAQA